MGSEKPTDIVAMLRHFSELPQVRRGVPVDGGTCGTWVEGHGEGGTGGWSDWWMEVLVDGWTG